MESVTLKNGKRKLEDGRNMCARKSAKRMDKTKELKG
jgi:hypothetical protein